MPFFFAMFFFCGGRGEVILGVSSIRFGAWHMVAHVLHAVCSMCTTHLDVPHRCFLLSVFTKPFVGLGFILMLNGEKKIAILKYFSSSIYYLLKWSHQFTCHISSQLVQ